MDMSKLQIYSIGIVAANKPLDSDEIEVTPTEQMNFADGQITDTQTTSTSSGTDSQGSAYSTSVDTTLTIKATWLPMGESNRVTPPDVRRGEYVTIWQFADQDKFYWQTLRNLADLRKLETVIFSISDTQDESVKSTAETTYYMEFSTHRKIIHIHTSKSDGEPFVYDWQLNTKDGSFLFQDDIGNYWSMDSKNVRHEFKNADGSWIDMNRKIINIFAPDTVNITAGSGNVNIKAGTDVTVQAGSAISETAGSSYSLKTGSTMSVNAGSTITTKSTGATHTAPITTFMGSVVISGRTTTTGMSSLAGGSFIVNAPGTFTQPIVVQQLTSTQAIIAPNVGN